MARDSDRDPGVEKLWGMPMRWESDKMFKNIWNEEDDRIFPPKYFGVGWDINFNALLRKAGLLRKSSAPPKDRS